jgi:hypothetical protein
MVFLGRHENGAIVMGMRYLLDFMDFHEQLSVALSSACEKYIQSLRIGHVKDLPVVGEVHPHDVLRVLFDYLRRLEHLEQPRCELDSLV